MVQWPVDVESCQAVQIALGESDPVAWRPPSDYSIGGCFVCFPRGLRGVGAEGDQAWAGAACVGAGTWETSAIAGRAGDRYRPGFLALREGPLLESAVRSLAEPPDVLLVNATGRDHPRRAGLALHLGMMLGIPSIGVTHRPLLAEGAWPDDSPGAWAPLRLDGTVVGAWLRTRRGHRPLAVHLAWRTGLDDALTVLRQAMGPSRTPEPLRRARQVARRAREAAR